MTLQPYPYRMIRDLSKIYYGPERISLVRRFGRIYDLSSGVSSLSTPLYYKRLMGEETERDFFYRWYSGPEGSEVAVNAVLFFENYLAGRGTLKSVFSRDQVALSVGSSALIAFFFEYYRIHYAWGNQKVLMVGMNYFLFGLCCAENGLRPVEIISERGDKTYVTALELVERIWSEKPGLLVLTIPGNPSGECYNPGELGLILAAACETGTWLLLDRVCLDEISFHDDYINLTALVTEKGDWERTLLVNSLSKSRSLAGYRLGYAVGSQKAVSYIKQRNYYFFFSPPGAGVMVMIIDMLVRCLLRNGRETAGELASAKLFHLFKNFLSWSCPLTPGGHDADLPLGQELFRREDLGAELQTVIGDLRKQYLLILSNLEQIPVILGDQMEAFVFPAHGYNCVIKLSKFRRPGQMETACRLFREWGLEILPEQCFRVESLTGDTPFWFRISAAAPTEWFQDALERLRDAHERY